MANEMDNSQERPRRSRESLVRAYDAQGAARARNARLQSQEAIREFQAREARMRARNAQGRQPMTAQESHDRTQMSREAYERARARRDVNSQVRQSRTSNRELIDGRGSIDSRAFNEKNELVGYSIDNRDKPEPLIDASSTKGKWHSRAGQGANAVTSDQPMRRGFARREDLGSLSDTISGRSEYSSNTGIASIPLIVKVLVVLIVVLLIVLVKILFF